MDQDEKTESGIRQQARDLFGSAGGRARAGVRQAHGFIQGRPRYEQVLIVGMLSFAALMAVLIVYLIILIPLTPGIDDLKQVSSARPSSPAAIARLAWRSSCAGHRAIQAVPERRTPSR